MPQPREKDENAKVEASGPTTIAIAAIGAVILVAVLIGLLSPSGDPTVSPDRPLAKGVARLGATRKAEWIMPGRNTEIPEGAKLVADRRLELGRGLAQIRFNSGAEILLEGPAVFEPSGQNGGALHSGKLTADVPPQAAGFSVQTPGALIVDLGAEFGVAVELDGSSEVEVFSGNVKISPARPQGDGSSACQFQRGQIALIGPTATGRVALPEEVVLIVVIEHPVRVIVPAPHLANVKLGAQRFIVKRLDVANLVAGFDHRDDFFRRAGGDLCGLAKVFRHVEVGPPVDRVLVAWEIAVEIMDERVADGDRRAAALSLVRDGEDNVLARDLDLLGVLRIVV